MSSADAALERPLDDDGFLYIVGRSDDAINPGNFKIVPTMITDVPRRADADQLRQ